MRPLQRPDMLTTTMTTATGTTILLSGEVLDLFNATEVCGAAGDVRGGVDDAVEIHASHSARKAITLIVKAANAGGAHMILVVLSVSLLLSA
jgi:hypothetical protein